MRRRAAMRKFRRRCRLLGVLTLLTALLVALIPVDVFAVSDEALIPNNSNLTNDITWYLEPSGDGNYSISIEGTGDLPVFDSSNPAPWNGDSVDTTDTDILTVSKDHITGLVIGEGITGISEYAFADMSNLVGDLEIPSSVTHIGKSAFRGTGFDGELTLGNGLVTIGDYAFSNSAKVNDQYVGIAFTGNLSLPDTLQTIGIGAFAGCSGFAGALAMPESVTLIGDDAFNGCSGLNGALTLTDNITSIGMNAFKGCSSLTSLNLLPSPLEAISEGVFQDCSALIGEVAISESVTTVGQNAFYGTNLDVDISSKGSSLTSIGDRAFQNCTGLSNEYTIPEKVNKIGRYAFDGSSVRQVTFNGTGSIEVDSHAFSKVLIYHKGDKSDIDEISEAWNGNLLYPDTERRVLKFFDTSIDTDNVSFDVTGSDSALSHGVMRITLTNTRLSNIPSTVANGNFRTYDVVIKRDTDIRENCTAPIANAELTLPYPETWDLSKGGLEIYSDDGSAQPIEPSTGTSANPNPNETTHTVTFPINHFSEYALVYRSNTEGQTGETGTPEYTWGIEDNRKAFVNNKTRKVDGNEPSPFDSSLYLFIEDLEKEDADDISAYVSGKSEFSNEDSMTFQLITRNSGDASGTVVAKDITWTIPLTVPAEWEGGEIELFQWDGEKLSLLESKSNIEHSVRLTFGRGRGMFFIRYNSEAVQEPVQELIDNRTDTVDKDRSQNSKYSYFTSSKAIDANSRYLFVDTTDGRKINSVLTLDGTYYYDQVSFFTLDMRDKQSGGKKLDKDEFGECDLYLTLPEGMDPDLGSIRVVWMDSEGEMQELVDPITENNGVRWIHFITDYMSECAIIYNKSGQAAYRLRILNRTSSINGAITGNVSVSPLPKDWYLIVSDVATSESKIVPLIQADASLSGYKVQGVYDISLMDARQNGNPVVNFGVCRINIPLPDAVDAVNGVLRVVSMEGNELDKSITTGQGMSLTEEEPTVSFYTNHFTEFAVLYAGNPEAVANANATNTGATNANQSGTQATQGGTAASNTSGASTSASGATGSSGTSGASASGSAASGGSGQGAAAGVAGASGSNAGATNAANAGSATTTIVNNGDMPRTGDRSSYKMFVVVMLAILGVIELLISIPPRRLA